MPPKERRFYGAVPFCRLHHQRHKVEKELVVHPDRSGDFRGTDDALSRWRRWRFPSVPFGAFHIVKPVKCCLKRCLRALGGAHLHRCSRGESRAHRRALYTLTPDDSVQAGG